MAKAPEPEEVRAFIFHMCISCSKTFNAVPYFWCSDLDLEGWPTLKKIVLDYDFWIRGVTYCCYLHMVAAGELCCLSDNSGLCCWTSTCYMFYRRAAWAWAHCLGCWCLSWPWTYRAYTVWRICSLGFSPSVDTGWVFCIFCHDFLIIAKVNWYPLHFVTLYFEGYFRQLAFSFIYLCMYKSANWKV